MLFFSKASLTFENIDFFPKSISFFWRSLVLSSFGVISQNVCECLLSGGSGSFFYDGEVVYLCSAYHLFVDSNTYREVVKFAVFGVGYCYLIV